jgi:hypothetical protein
MSRGAPIHASAKGRHTVLSFDGRVLTIRSTGLRVNAVRRTRGGYPVSGRRVSAIQRRARTSSVRPARRLCERRQARTRGPIGLRHVGPLDPKPG